MAARRPGHFPWITLPAEPFDRHGREQRCETQPVPSPDSVQLFLIGTQILQDPIPVDELIGLRPKPVRPAIGRVGTARTGSNGAGAAASPASPSASAATLSLNQSPRAHAARPLVISSRSYRSYPAD